MNLLLNCYFEWIINFIQFPIVINSSIKIKLSPQFISYLPILTENIRNMTELSRTAKSIEGCEDFGKTIEVKLFVNISFLF